MTERQGVLFLANFPADTGHAWRFIENLSAAVAAELGTSHFHASFIYPSAGKRSLPERRGALSVRAERAAGTGPLAALSLLWLALRDRPYAVYLNDRSSWSILYSALRLVGVRKIILHDHTSGIRHPASRVRRIVKTLLSSIPGATVDSLIAVSRYVAARHERHGTLPAARIFTVYNGIEPQATSARRGENEDEASADAGIVRIGCVARAVPEKGVQILLKAFELLADTGAPVRLVYAGTGPYFEELDELRSSLRHQHLVTFVGSIASGTDFFRDMDIAVVPSVWAEAFGLTALEAMQAGLPTVVSDTGGLSEIVRSGIDGVSVPAGDFQALAAALKTLVESRAYRERLGNAAQERVRTSFSLKLAAQAIAQVIADRPT